MPTTTIPDKSLRKLQKLLDKFAPELEQLPAISEAERLELFWSHNYYLFSDQQARAETARIQAMTETQINHHYEFVNRVRSQASPRALNIQTVSLDPLRWCPIPVAFLLRLPSCNHYMPLPEAEPDFADLDCPICAAQLAPHSGNPLHYIKIAEPLNTKKVYLGVELEVEVPGFHNKAAQWLPEFKTLFKSSAILKSDGTIRDGFEICTVPFLLDKHAELWGKVYSDKLFAERVKADDQANVGLHIHASRAPLSAGQIARYVYFMNAPENYRGVVEIAGREGNGFTQYNPSITRVIAAHKANIDRGRGYNTKYEVVNLLHPNSIEVRAFQSTKVYELMMSRLEFVLAGLNFVDMKTAKDLMWPKFMDWLSGSPQRKEFGRLGAFLQLTTKPTPLKGGPSPRSSGGFTEQLTANRR